MGGYAVRGALYAGNAEGSSSAAPVRTPMASDASTNSQGPRLQSLTRSRGTAPVMTSLGQVQFMRWVLLMRNLSRCPSSLCRIALIAIGFGISGYVGQASAQDTAKAGLSTRNNVEFLAVKIRAAQMQPELSRLDQELETFAARLMDRSDLSPTAKASAISQVERARAVLHSYAETLRRAAANLTDWTTAGQEIDALAEMLNMRGEQTLRAVTDEIARRDGNADQLVMAATAYRAAVTQLVEAARKAREHSQVVGGSRGGSEKR